MRKLFARNRIAAALAVPKGSYVVEAMEPRVLLSADVIVRHPAAFVTASSIT